MPQSSSKTSTMAERETGPPMETDETNQWG